MADRTPTRKPPILDLSVLEVFTVKAPNGQSYPMNSRAARSVRDLRRLMKLGARVDELAAKLDTATDDELDEFIDLLDKTCREIWEAPDDVHRSLDDRQRLDVIQGFLTLHSPTALPVTGATETQAETEGLSTSASSPADSAASTPAVIPGNG